MERRFKKLDYKTRDKLIYDKQQTKLTETGIAPNTFKFARKQDNTDFNTKVLCPFCLTEQKLYLFFENSGLRICPNCGNKMKPQTLTKQMTIEEFARWVYEYRLNGFFKKVYPNFELWCTKLKELGISYEFWENYKRLRGDNDKEENDNEN